MNRLLEQKRAAYCLDFVREVAIELRPKMATQIDRTPIRILTNGLGQALAFLLSRQGKEEGPAAHQLYQHLQGWLSGEPDHEHPMRIYRCGPPELMRQLIDGSRADYLSAQEECLRLFTWLRKLAAAEFGAGE